MGLTRERLWDKLVYDNLNTVFQNYYGNYEWQLRKNHRKFLKSYVYKSSNFKDYYFLRYLGNVCKATNERLFPKCICGEPNIPGHAADFCEDILSSERRKHYKKRLDDVYRSMGKKVLASLHAYIIHVYFVLEHRKEKELKKAISAVRNLVFECVTRSNPEVGGN